MGLSVSDEVFCVLDPTALFRLSLSVRVGGCLGHTDAVEGGSALFCHRFKDIRHGHGRAVGIDIQPGPHRRVGELNDLGARHAADPR